MADQAFRSFDDFWPFYVREHSKKGTRMLHFAGTTLAFGMAAAGLLTRRRGLLLAAPIVGYGMSWIGHFFVEGNKPATWTYPAWSYRGDMIMWWKTLTGTMDAEVERVTQGNGVSEPRPEAAPAAHVHPV